MEERVCSAFGGMSPEVDHAPFLLQLDKAKNENAKLEMELYEVNIRYQEKIQETYKQHETACQVLRVLCVLCVLCAVFTSLVSL